MQNLLISVEVPGGLPGRGFHEHFVKPNPGEYCRESSFRSEVEEDFASTLAACGDDAGAMEWALAHKDLWF